MIQKGEKSRNPNGRPKNIENILKEKGLSKQEIIDKISSFLIMDTKEHKRLFSNDDTPAIDKLILSIITKGIATGCTARMDSLLDRIIGKVSIDHQVNGDVQINILSFSDTKAKLEE